jgi:hypothetical protein
MLDDQPAKRKQKTDTSITTTGQSTHNVEQDGYGTNISPTTTVHISAWPTTVNGKLYRTMWCDLDFSKKDEKNQYTVISSQVLFHNGSLLHSQLNTQLLNTVHNCSRILTLV